MHLACKQWDEKFVCTASQVNLPSNATSMDVFPLAVGPWITFNFPFWKSNSLSILRVNCRSSCENSSDHVKCTSRKPISAAWISRLIPFSACCELSALDFFVYRSNSSVSLRKRLIRSSETFPVIGEKSVSILQAKLAGMDIPLVKIGTRKKIRPSCERRISNTEKVSAMNRDQTCMSSHEIDENTIEAMKG